MFHLDWPHSDGLPKATALFKMVPEDFRVDELFSTQFTGVGEHILLHIEKRGLTTEEVVISLARLINKPAKLISYAGLKDRHALTTQWLSVHAPGETIEGIEYIEAPGWKVLQAVRHNKKLKPGFLLGNRFSITLRNIIHVEDLITRIERVKHSGVPNYFGEQRFGREAGNLFKAQSLLLEGKKVKDRFLRGMYYSAARSWLYNLVLGTRVKESNWNIPLAGDVMQLTGSNSIFVIDEVTDELLNRVNEQDVAPASPLPGKSKNLVKGEALQIIQGVYNDWLAWLAALEKEGLEEAWRSNVLLPENLEYSIEEDRAHLTFSLPAGAYATVVLRELVHYSSL